MSDFIRKARIADCSAIANIYKEHVLHGTASFEVVPPSEEEMKKRMTKLLDQHFPYAVFVRDDRVLGYCYLAPYRTRYAYRFTVENSVYVDKEAVSSGIGTKLLTWLIAQCQDRDWQEIVAVIGDSDNKPSIALHEKCGFEHVGTLKRVGYKFDCWIDSVIMQYSLRDNQSCGVT